MSGCQESFWRSRRCKDRREKYSVVRDMASLNCPVLSLSPDDVCRLYDNERKNARIVAK